MRNLIIATCLSCYTIRSPLITTTHHRNAPVEPVTRPTITNHKAICAVAVSVCDRSIGGDPITIDEIATECGIDKEDSDQIRAAIEDWNETYPGSCR